MMDGFPHMAGDSVIFIGYRGRERRAQQACSTVNHTGKKDKRMGKMEQTTIAALYTLEETIAKELFDGLTYPWEALPLISDFIVRLGQSLPEDRYEQVKEHVWIAKSAKVFPSAYINGPAIIDEEAEVRQCAFIRGNAIVGKKAVVGNSTELKNVVLFNNVQVPHYN